MNTSPLGRALPAAAHFRVRPTVCGHSVLRSLLKLGLQPCYFWLICLKLNKRLYGDHIEKKWKENFWPQIIIKYSSIIPRDIRILIGSRSRASFLYPWYFNQKVPRPYWKIAKTNFILVDTSRDLSMSIFGPIRARSVVFYTEKHLHGDHIGKCQKADLGYKSGTHRNLRVPI